MNVLIATFSQFGTTAAIGEEIARGLQSAGATGNRVRRRLRRAGGVDVGYFAAHGADIFLGYLREGVLFSPDHPNGDERMAAREFGVIVAKRAEQMEWNADCVEPYDPPTPVLYALERASMNRFFIRTTLARAFHVDDRCISCGVCTKRCPAGNISRTDPITAEKPRWGTDCLMCGTCALVCPSGAVRSPYDWKINRIVMRLNVQRGKRAGVPFFLVDPADRSTWDLSL